MKTIKFLVISFFVMNFSFALKATSNSGLDEINQLSKVNPSYSEQIVNLNVKDYISSNNDKRKLLLCCGHNVIEDPFYTTSLAGTYDIHTHEGWYTVDTNPHLKPDYIGDLTAPKTMDDIFHVNTWDIVYFECAVHYIMTEDLLTIINHSLRPNGVVIFQDLSFDFPCTIKGEEQGVNFEIKSRNYYNLPRFLKNNLEGKLCSFSNLERLYKGYFEEVLSFSNASLYSDTLFPDDWTIKASKLISEQVEGECQKIYIESADKSDQKINEMRELAKSRSQELMNEERAKKIATTFIFESENPSINQNSLSAYTQYLTILNQYDSHFSNMRKGSTFVILKK